MKWIDKIVERITRKEMTLNNHFCVNQHRVVCLSGMVDCVSVTIDNADSFSFDFWTKRLYIENGCKYHAEIREAFVRIYGAKNIISSE